MTPRAKGARSDRLTPREFLRVVLRDAGAQLPPRLRDFRSSAFGFGLGKVWYGNGAIHYEVWLRPRLRTLELGLHFEADPLTNARLLAAFSAKERVVRRALGGEPRIEAWDKGWARVWEPHALDDLDDAFARRIATRLADYVRALEPVLRAELPNDVAWDEPRRGAAATAACAKRTRQEADRRRDAPRTRGAAPSRASRRARR